jgi:AraC-like DNA-binding protein
MILQEIIFLFIMLHLFVTFFLILKSKNYCAIRIVGYFQLVTLLLILSGFLTVIENPIITPTIASFSAIIFISLLIAFPPLCYQLFNTIIEDEKVIFKRNYYIALILFIVNLLSWLYIHYLEPSQISMYKLVEQTINYCNYILILFILPISAIFYYIKIVRIFIKTNIVNSQIKKLLLNLFAAYSLLLISFTFQLKFKDGYGFSLFYCIVIYFTISIQILGMYYIKYSNSSEDSLLNRESDEIELFEQMKENLEPTLIRTKSYLNPKYTLKQCARSIGSNEKLLSAYLNKVHKMNFNTYINGFRIETAKELLNSKDSDKFTIETIAKMSGFNSKSSFNSVFKKYTGQTPSEFKINR